MNIKQNKLEVLKAGADDSLNLLDPVLMEEIEGGKCGTNSCNNLYICPFHIVINPSTPDPSGSDPGPDPDPNTPTPSPTPSPEDEPTDEPTEDE